VPLLPRSVEDAPAPLRDALLFGGGVKGRNPPWLGEPDERFELAGDSGALEPEFSKVRLSVPRLAEPMLGDPDARALGGVNGRETPRFPFSADDGLPRLLVPVLPASRFEKVPAPGFCIVPVEPAPRAMDSPPTRPLGVTAPT